MLTQDKYGSVRKNGPNNALCRERSVRVKVFEWLLRFAQRSVFYLCALNGTDALARDWVLVTAAGSTTYEARDGTLEYLVASDQKPIAMLLFRVKDNVNQQTVFVRNYVRIADCQTGFGKLVTTDVNGNPTINTDFVFDGGNVASEIAKAICTAHSEIQKTDGKRKRDAAF
jgi:hypothetical protein